MNADQQAKIRARLVTATNVYGANRDDDWPEELRIIEELFNALSTKCEPTKITWKRASEIARSGKSGFYWIDDRRPDGKPSSYEQWYVVKVLESFGTLFVPQIAMSQEGEELQSWDKNIYMYGPFDMLDEVGE